MTAATRVAVVGAGAFGVKHLDALARIDDVEVAAVVSRTPDQAREVADRYGAPIATIEYEDVLRSPAVDAVILCTPTPLHAAQAVAALRAGKHVQVEIPLADSWAGAGDVARASRDAALVCMVGHTRRFNPSHQWIHQRVVAGEPHHPADGRPDLLLSSHQHQRARPAAQLDGQPAVAPRRAHGRPLRVPVRASQSPTPTCWPGPTTPNWASRWTCRSSSRTASGQLCTLSLSFNNDGPLGTFFRYIGDTGTYVARYDDLVTGHNEPIDVSGVAVSMDGIELQDREFVRAVREGVSPNSSIDDVLGCYEVLARLQGQLDAASAR